MTITTAGFNRILAKNGEAYTLITEGTTTYDSDYGSIDSQSTSETTITVYAEPLSDTEPLVMQGKVRSGSRRAFIKPTDGVSNNDLLQDSDDVKWKVIDKMRWPNAGTAIYDEFIMVRNE